MRRRGGMHKGFAHYFAGVLAVLAIAGLSGCSLLTPTRDQVAPQPVRTKLTTPTITEKGVLTVALDTTDAPQAMVDANGRLTGYTADVARAVAQRLGLKVVFVDSGTPESVGGSGEADVYLGATDAAASDSIAVTGYFLEDAPALFAKAEPGATAPETPTAESLASATIGVQTSSVAQDVLSACGITARQQTYGNVNDCLAALANGQVDYVACDATAGAYLARAYPGVQFVGSLDTPTSFGISVSARNAQLSSAVTEALDAMAADGTLEAIRLAWYGDLPSTLANTLVAGITTSDERRAAEEAAAAAQEEQDGDEEASYDSGDASDPYDEQEQAPEAETYAEE